jgi:hypothetical protein
MNHREALLDFLACVVYLERSENEISSVLDHAHRLASRSRSTRAARAESGSSSSYL